MIQNATHQERNEIAEALLACPINCPVDLQILAGSHIYRLRSRLLGIDIGHFLMLRFGTDQSWKDASHCLKPEQPVILRMVNEIGQCQILAFRSSLGVSPTVPRKWLTVHYPKIIESANMRRQRRIRVSFDCYIEWEERGQRVVQGIIVDLSSQGCRITVNINHPVENGTEIFIRFKGEFSQLIIPGIVRNSSLSTSGILEHGVQFTEMGSDMRTRLSELMLASY